ncbi:Gag-polypeptide of LTR copia-type [Sesbania bispinosa]|nr:Gag-polypeptide of LTR copia-type [Sesbania bispinosa]
MEDPSNSLFLHHSNGLGLGLVLLSQPLTGCNYSTWSRDMAVALSMKNKTSFIGDSIPKLDAANHTYGSWLYNNYVLVVVLDLNG